MVGLATRANSGAADAATNDQDSDFNFFRDSCDAHGLARRVEPTTENS
jgi:hypothetical protein